METGRLRDAIAPHDDGTVTVEGTDDDSPAAYYDIVERPARSRARCARRRSRTCGPLEGLLLTQVPAIARGEIVAAVAAEVAAMRAGQKG